MRGNPGAQVSLQKQVAKALPIPLPPSLGPLFMTTLFILIDFIVFIYIGSSASLVFFFLLFVILETMDNYCCKCTIIIY